MTKRLNRLLELCGTGNTLADIGCDHGKLAADALLSGRFSNVIAADISAGSLNKARKLAQQLKINIDFRVGDGLSVITPGEVDVIIIAGMGAPLIINILKNSSDVAKNARLVLCPNSYPERLRKFLIDESFCIQHEEIVSEGRFYPMMVAKFGDPFPYTHAELIAGKCLKNADYSSYLNYRARSSLRIADTLHAAGKDPSPALELARIFNSIG